MKKLILLLAVTLFAFNVNAQGDSDGSSNGLGEGFRVGVNAGIPVTSGVSDFYSFVINADIDYDWNVSEKFNAGLTTGLTYYLGKDGFDGFKYLPIAASADVEITDGFSAGADVGYAISLETGGGGDFLWRGVIRYQASEEVDVTARYNSVSGNGSSIDYASLGVGFRF